MIFKFNVNDTVGRWQTSVQVENHHRFVELTIDDGYEHCVLAHLDPARAIQLADFLVACAKEAAK